MMKKNNNVEKTYIDSVHTQGKLWTVLALLVLVSVPLLFSIFGGEELFSAFPKWNILTKVLVSVISVYWTTAIIEVITYTPMLGAGGTYLSFVTGNITNLKLPCALSAMDRANVKATSEEGEIVSTIAIGASAITTTVILAVGVIAFAPFLGYITDPESILRPAFVYVVPALFGALGASYFAKHWRISIFPILVGILVYVFVPTLAVGTMIFVTIVAAVGGALAMWKLKLLK